MSVFIGVGIGFWPFTGLLFLLLLLLLSFARSFLSLLPGILLRLQKALLFLRLLQLHFFLGVQLLLFKFLLCSSGRFCSEVLHFLLFLGQFNLSFLLFNHCVHLCLLH